MPALPLTSHVILDVSLTSWKPGSFSVTSFCPHFFQLRILVLRSILTYGYLPVIAISPWPLSFSQELHHIMAQPKVNNQWLHTKYNDLPKWYDTWLVNLGYVLWCSTKDPHKSHSGLTKVLYHEAGDIKWKTGRKKNHPCDPSNSLKRYNYI